MKKIDTNILKQIFMDSAIYNKFVRFDENQSFFNGTYEEYYYALNDYANDLSYKLTQEYNNEDMKWLINYLNLMVVDSISTHFSDIAYHKFFYYYPSMKIENPKAAEEVSKIYEEINYDKNIAHALTNYHYGVDENNYDDVYGALASKKDMEKEVVDSFFTYALSGKNRNINPFLIEVYAIKLTERLLEEAGIKVDVRFEDIDDATVLGLNSVKDGSIAYNSLLPYIMYADKAKKEDEKIEPSIVLDVIYHEVEHAIEKFNPVFNYEHTQSLKDIALLEVLGDKYYSDNYLNINCEKGIHSTHSAKVIEYLSKISPESISSYKKHIMKNDVKKADLRILNNQYINIDVLFKTIAHDNPSMVKNHPDLLIEYYESGKIKSTARLMHEMKTIQMDKQDYIKELILNRTFDKKGLYEDILLSLTYNQVDSVIFAKEVDMVLASVIGNNIVKIEKINGNDIFIDEIINNLMNYKKNTSNPILAKRLDQMANLLVPSKTRTL